jgi:serine/threonine protein kinase
MDSLTFPTRTASLCACLAHSDIATRNFLVGAGPVVKISDFGLGRCLDLSQYYRTKGGMMPVRWLAPEAVHYGG